MRWRRRAAVVVLVTCLAGGAGYVAAHDYVLGAAFVVKAAGMHGIARTLAEWETRAVDEQSLTVPWRGGTLPARTYQPRGSRRRAFLLVPGILASGVDEPRLIGFARDLASMGHPVLTVGPPDLARYTISPSVTDAIEDAASWLSQQRTLAPDGRIGMMGISFAGGLSIVAAGEGSALYLEELAATGGGLYYPATDMLSVPDIFLNSPSKVSPGQIKEITFL